MESIIDEVVFRILNSNDLSDKITQKLVLRANEAILTISDPQMREKRFKDVSLALIKKGFYSLAVVTASKIKSVEYRSYVFSIIVGQLASKRKFDEAATVFSKIEDAAYREDALGYIMRAFGNLKEAKNFVHSLQDPHEKTLCEKWLF